jgi:hypothetical protein
VFARVTLREDRLTSGVRHDRLGSARRLEKCVRVERPNGFSRLAARSRLHLLGLARFGGGI